MKIIKRTVQGYTGKLHFSHPENDDTLFGTMSCLQRDRFHLRDVKFSPGDVMVDIGCNIGLLSLSVASLNPQVRVYGFDASPLAIQCFREGIAANQFENVQCFQVAVGAESKKGVKFYSNGKEFSCIVQEGLNTSNPVPDAVVNMISIDDIFDSALLGIDRVRYLKMDIEGGELVIFDRLFGARQDILDRIDCLHLEIHGDKTFDATALSEKVLAKFGDRVFFDT